jgi:hypothetical protein
MASTYHSVLKLGTFLSMREKSILLSDNGITIYVIIAIDDNKPFHGELILIIVDVEVLPAHSAFKMFDTRVLLRIAKAESKGTNFAG